MSATYTLSIQIAHNQFQWLKKNQYKLCIARQTNEAYTTIWESIDFNERPKFEWQQAFQAFWVKTFTSGLEVQSECNPVPIGYGQKVTILPDTSMDTPSGKPNFSGSFEVVNNSGMPVNVGLNAQVNGKWNACYVSPVEVLNGATTKLTPLTTVKVWFEMKAKSQSMITEISGTPQEVTFEATTHHKVTFTGATEGAGDWNIAE